MIDRILLAVDGSALDEAAFAETRRVAAGGAEIHLVHVVPSTSESVGAPLMGMVEAPVAVEGPSVQGGTQIQDQAVRYLEGFRRRLRGVPGQDIVRTGDAAEAIRQVARMFDASLIVMSTHARTGLSRWFLGSVSETVLRGSRLPVLLVRAGAPVRSERLRRILVYVNDTAESRAILSVVKPMAARVHAEIVQLEVMERKADGGFRRTASGETAEPGAAWEVVTARGDPVDEILRHAKSRDADLVALSVRAPRGLGRALGKSLPQAILSRIDRPLLLQMPVIPAGCCDESGFRKREVRLPAR